MQFTVTYRGASGASELAVVEATSRADCLAQMRARGVSVISVKEGGRAGQKNRPSGRKLRKARGGTPGGPTMLLVLCAVIALLVGGGLWWMMAGRSVNVAPQDDKPTKPKEVSTSDDTRYSRDEPKEVSTEDDAMYAPIMYGKYSNLSDPAFRAYHNAEILSNYWDSARYGMVYKGIIKENEERDSSTFFTSIIWVEKDRKVVEFRNFFLHFDREDRAYKPSPGTDNPILDALQTVRDVILRMDGCLVIGSTKNMTYRGRSAQLCEDEWDRWLRNYRNPNTIPAFGIQWFDTDKKIYILVYIKAAGMFEYEFIMSDRRIEYGAFEDTMTVRDIDERNRRLQNVFKNIPNL